MTARAHRAAEPTRWSEHVTMFDSLLHGLDDQEQDRTRELIADSVATDRADALAGKAPDRLVDSGSRRRRSRAETQRR